MKDAVYRENNTGKKLGKAVAIVVVFVAGYIGRQIGDWSDDTTLLMVTTTLLTLIYYGQKE